jgi:membrane protease YdiL (CAAX protease family)
MPSEEAVGSASATRPRLDRKGLFSFLTITFAITYAIEGALIRGGFRISPGAFSLGQFIIAAVMWVPALATVLTVKFVTREGFAIANVRFGGWRPYVAVGLIVPGCFFIIYALTWMSGLGRPDWSLESFRRLVTAASGTAMPPMPAPAVVLPLVFLATLVVTPVMNSVLGFGEELGWRGYLLPKLLPLGKPRAYALLGLVWGLWHLPLVLVGFTYPGHPLGGALMFVALTTAFGIYLNELTLRHRSSVLAGWAHGVFNSQKLGVWALLFPSVNPMLGGFAGALGVGVWIILALVVSRRRRR